MAGLVSIETALPCGLCALAVPSFLLPSGCFLQPLHHLGQHISVNAPREPCDLKPSQTPVVWVSFQKGSLYGLYSGMWWTSWDTPTLATVKTGKAFGTLVFVQFGFSRIPRSRRGAFRAACSCAVTTQFRAFGPTSSCHGKNSQGSWHPCIPTISILPGSELSPRGIPSSMLLCSHYSIDLSTRWGGAALAGQNSEGSRDPCIPTIPVLPQWAFSPRGIPSSMPLCSYYSILPSTRWGTVALGKNSQCSCHPCSSTILIVPQSALSPRGIPSSMPLCSHH